MSSLSGKCGGEGWTLVMKLDRNEVKHVTVNSLYNFSIFLWYTAKNAIDLLQVVNFTGLLQLVTTMQQACQFH